MQSDGEKTMLKSCRTWLVLAGICAMALAAPCQAAFQDPLDIPAVHSKLAPKGVINGLAFAGKRMVSVGQRGHILYSDDAGQNWIQANVPVSTDLTAVFFASSTRGWAVGHGGVVLTTTDAGGNWVKQLDGRSVGKLMASHYADHSPDGMSAEQLTQLRADAARFAEEGPDKPFLDLWFESETTGYIVGLFNMVFKTSDGGATWIPWFDRTDNPKLFHFYAIRSVGGELYLAGEQGMVLKLDKAAQRFKQTPVDYQGTFFGITGKSGAVIVYGLRGNAYRSVNNGATWQKIETGVTVGLTGARVMQDGRILLVSQAGQVLASSDDGLSFTRLKLDRQVPAAALLETPGNSLVMGGMRGLHSLAIK
jgi:photosystem II stability/assembly factor-like uncharacterized protein